jgi:hypothetical protein
MSARAERNIATVQAGHFGQAQSCLQGHQQQRVIPPAFPGAFVWRIQERIDLRARHEVDQPAVEAFGRHGEDALDLSAMGRHLIGGEAEERPNGGEALLSEAQQKPERVPVGPDRMRADPLLLHQPLREEPLQERREGRECGGHAEASQ